MNDMNNKNNLIIEYKTDDIVSLTINRPEVGNAFDDALIKALLDALTELEQTDIRLLILQSSGKHFSAGADLNWMQNARNLSREDNLKDAQQLAELMHKLHCFPAPTMALVQGAAYGGALGLIAACDIALCSDSARFCLSEVKIGLIPATISPYVIEAIGVRQARRYFLTAELIPAEQALNIGLVHETCSGLELEEKAESLAKQIVANSPAATRAAKQLIKDVGNQRIDEDIINSTCEVIADIRTSDEGQEGLTAFLDKREPLWKR